MRRIEKLESDVDFKQRTLEQLRREKIELENTLEQEQEALVNRLWKKMEHSEAEKRMLGARLEAIPAALQIYAQQVTALQSGSASCTVAQPATPVGPAGAVHYAPVCVQPSHPAVHARMSTDSVDPNEDALCAAPCADTEPRSLEVLEHDVVELKRELYKTHAQAAERISHLEHAEHLLVDENLRLRRRLHLLELDRSRASLNRHHSESESSLEAGAGETGDAHAQRGAAQVKERSRNVSNSGTAPMNVDRPGSAGPIPVRCGPPTPAVPGPTVSLLQTGSQASAAPGQSPSAGHHDSLQLQLVANLHVSASQQSPGVPSTRADQSSSAAMPRVCRECGAQLVVYASSAAGFVSGTVGAGAHVCASARASLSSLTGLLVPTPPGSAAPNAFRD